jgi:high-affinity nickel permease
MFSEETIQGEFLELIEDIGLAVFGYPLVLIGIICLICSCFSYAKDKNSKMIVSTQVALSWN